MSSEKNRPEATIDDGVSDGDAVPAALAVHKWIEGAAAEEDGLSPRVEDASALVAESKWSGASGMAADSIIDIGQTPPPDEPEGAGKVIPGEGVFPLGPDDDRAQSASRPPTGASAGDGRERKESYNDAPPNQAGEPEAQDVGVRSKTSSGGSASEKAAAEGQLSAADSADSKSRAMTPAGERMAPVPYFTTACYSDVNMACRITCREKSSREEVGDDKNPPERWGLGHGRRPRDDAIVRHEHHQHQEDHRGGAGYPPRALQCAAPTVQEVY